MRRFCLASNKVAGSFCDLSVTLAPPLPIYLFSLVAGLREKNAKGYPVKKVGRVFPWRSYVLKLTDLSATPASVEGASGMFWWPKGSCPRQRACQRY